MEFWELTLRFLSLGDINVRNVVLGSILLGGAAGGLSTFVYLQKRSLLGDALAHAALPGVGLAYIVIGEKNLFALLVGAVITAWLGALAVDRIVKNSRIKLDSALGIVLSTFFGLGIVLLTHIQKSGSGSQSGLDKFLFGQAAAISGQDVQVLAWMTGILLVIVLAAYGRLKILAFDPGFASGAGIKTGWWQFLLTTMVVVAVVTGLQAVGVVLMAAMLITPAAAARQWTDRLWLMILLASLFGGISGFMGAYISFLAPRLPTGPWIVVVVSLIFFVSVMFAPKRGVISRWRKQAQRRDKMAREHVLKLLFKVGQEDKDWSRRYGFDELMGMWSFVSSELRRALNKLIRMGWVVRRENAYGLTDSGVTEGARVLRRHRLWELYLTRYLDLPADHVHRDAEEMEHVLTPEMERQLEEELGYPESDPHDQEIPQVGRKVRP